MKSSILPSKGQLSDFNRFVVRASDGMTALELLIAISLFSIFMSVFVVVTEALVAWIPSTNSASGTNHCTGQGLEQACINAAFDRMVESLELASVDDVAKEAVSVISDDCWHLPRSKEIYNAENLEWPDTYRVCLVKDPGSSESDPADLASSPNGIESPGLYLLQASPVDDAFWRKPVQRLFCRPIHLCIQDQSL
jgi:prepilin-type N-terminal cleavage/methylation domain-containing protein